jgi:hypothetical protein
VFARNFDPDPTARPHSGWSSSGSFELLPGDNMQFDGALRYMFWGLLAYLLIPCSRVLEKLTSSQLVKKFPGANSEFNL